MAGKEVGSGKVCCLGGTRSCDGGLLPRLAAARDTQMAYDGQASDGGHSCFTRPR